MMQMFLLKRPIKDSNLDKALEKRIELMMLYCVIISVYARNFVNLIHRILLVQDISDKQVDVIKELN